MTEAHEHGSEARGTDRRAAIKKGAAAAAAAGMVWSAPRIEGLSLRPNYAAAMTLSPLSVQILLSTSNFPEAIADCPGGEIILEGQFAEGSLNATAEVDPTNAGQINAISFNTDVMSVTSSVNANEANIGGNPTGNGPAIATVTYSCN